MQLTEFMEPYALLLCSRDHTNCLYHKAVQCRHFQYRPESLVDFHGSSILTLYKILTSPPPPLFTAEKTGKDRLEI